MNDTDDTKPSITMKTLALDLPIEVHERIERILGRRTDKASKKALGFEALNIGLNVMESALDDLDNPPVAQPAGWPK
ncbi:MAG: hypothetical protein DRQ64_00320 [Gammaproteobacteria bacterium]|nr:MAG: hypothetical protein DRQ64_00320 [Gammaproteobacteria bacterium]